MNRYPIFFRWLVWAVLVDWLAGRTLTRSAIFMPKSPPVILVYQGLGTIGQLAATASGLLVLVSLIWLAWVQLRSGKSLVFPITLANLVLLSLVFLFIPARGMLAVVYHLSLILAVALLGREVLFAPGEIEKKVAAGLAALALLASGLYPLVPAVYVLLGLPGPPTYIGTIFNSGELLVVLAAFALGWAYGRPASRRTWLLSTVPALAFSALHLANPAIAGVISIWSVGLSLYLPWPFYTFALWLVSLAVCSSLERREPAGWAILLLAAGGYTPQLSSHAFLGIAALALLLPSTAGTFSRRFADRLPAGGWLDLRLGFVEPADSSEIHVDVKGQRGQPVVHDHFRFRRGRVIQLLGPVRGLPPVPGEDLDLIE